MQEQKEWTTIIQPCNKLLNLNLKELWSYKDLILLFVRRDFVAQYKQTILGPLWFLIQPILTTVVFTVVFGNIAGIPTDGIPHILFYLSGLVIWNYFVACLTKTSDTFVANANIFGKVYFPRLTVPISIVITNVLTFIIQFVLFIVILTFFYLNGASIKPNIYMLLTPFLIVQMACLGLGFGILISSLTTKYRDLAFVVAFGTQLWMYLTPIVYPLSEIAPKWKWIYILNPMTSIVEFFRYAFLGVSTIRWEDFLLSVLFTILILLLGLISFNRVQRNFMDTV